MPELEKCDRYGNVLAYEKNRNIWTVVSLQFYLDYQMCYSGWAYLPPEPTVLT